jgi:hypothetical protein
LIDAPDKVKNTVKEYELPEGADDNIINDLLNDNDDEDCNILYQLTFFFRLNREFWRIKCGDRRNN